MRKLALNLSRMSQPCVREAIIVVSEMNDRLSPNMAPPTMQPAIIPVDRSMLSAMPAATGMMATMVPTDVPMAIDTKQAVTNRPAGTMLPGRTLSTALTVASTAPMALAALEKHPASMKMTIIIIMLPLAIPPVNSSMRRLRLQPRVMPMATVQASMNATRTGIL